MIMKIREKLYLLSGGYYGQLGNVYGVEHSDGILLIDCGTSFAFETICQNLRYWGFHEKDVTHILLTHGHDDHAGCAAAFQKLGAKIVIGDGDAGMLEQGHLGEDSPFSNHHQMPPCHPDRKISSDIDLLIGNIHVCAYTMPGHTNGSLIYHIILKQEQWLFTGDMFCCDGEKGDVATPWWKGDMSYDSIKLGQSFQRLWSMRLHPTVVMGGHMIPRIGKDAEESIRLAYQNYLLNNR